MGNTVPNVVDYNMRQATIQKQKEIMKMEENISKEYDAYGEYGYKNIDNYIKDKYSVCREERQYALFLYNILCKYGSKEIREKLDGEKKTKIEEIFEACQLKNAEVKHVFYEATFMRDFFKRDKRCAYVDKESLGNKLLNITCEVEEHKNPYEEGVHIKSEERFNYLLLAYVLKMSEENGANSLSNVSVQKEIMDSVLKAIITSDEEKAQKKIDSILDLNLGANTGRIRMNDIIAGMEKNEINQKVIEKIKRAKIMMNIKPDIAVIYEIGEKVYLKFLECKFESSEGSYNVPEDDKFESSEGGCNDPEDNSKTQTKAQEWVGKFICEQLKIETEIEHDEIKEKKRIEWGGAELLYFRRRKSKIKLKGTTKKVNAISLEEMIPI